MNVIYVVYVEVGLDKELVCVGVFTTSAEAEKCFEWWGKQGDAVHVKVYDLFEKFDAIMYDGEE